MPRMIDLLDKHQLTNLLLFSITITILVLLYFFQYKKNAGDCKGKVSSELTTADGQTYSRKAELRFQSPISSSDHQTQAKLS